MLETKPTCEKVWVLDAGSGHGAWSKLLGRKGYEVAGVDVSNVRMKDAKKGCTIKNTSFLVGDLMRAPFKRETFHVCFCSLFLHHFERVEFIIAELSRVTKRGGEFLICEPNGLNIVYRLTEFGKKFVSRKWLMLKGTDTTNETIHMPRSYVNFLRIHGFTNIKVIFCHSREQECSFDGKITSAFIHTYGISIGTIMLIRFILLKAVLGIPRRDLCCGQ